MGEECEFCGTTLVTYTLADEKRDRESYIVCPNCLVGLVLTSLSQRQFLRAKARGGDTNRFYLHDDFYDREGNALQPKV
jgi:hypothetical protein